MQGNRRQVPWQWEAKQVRLEELPGAEPQHVARLREAGIRNCRRLAWAGGRPDRLARLARESGLGFQLLQSLVGRAGLSRLRGIGLVMLGHLVQIGVESPEQLAGWEPEQVQERLRTCLKPPPNLALIESWILQARARGGRITGRSHTADFHS
jgi:hypothetical protein